MKGFKEFILQGNVVALAVGFVIGGAFGTVVKAFVSDIITPLVAIPGSGADFSTYSFTIGHGKFLYGDFVNAIGAFVIVAAAVYFGLVAPMQHLNARRAGPAVDSPTRACPECLSDIPKAASRCAFCTAQVAPTV